MNDSNPRVPHQSQTVNSKHGYAKNGKRVPEYEVWVQMRARCLNTNHKHYASYGGRGISICVRWMESFSHFISDMGFRPSKKHSLDRIENDGNYEPGNCKWSTQSEQMNNIRRNKLITHQGKTLSASQWSRELGINLNLIYGRLRDGWSGEKAITEPIKKSYSHPKTACKKPVSVSE